MDLIGCLSERGQSLLAQVTSLQDGQILSLDDLRGVAESLMDFTGQLTEPRLLVGGDVRVAGEMLNQLTMQLDTLLPEGSSDEEAEFGMAVDSLGRIANSLVNSDLSPAWVVGVAEGAEFDASDFLFSLELMSGVMGRYLNITSNSSQLLYSNLLVRAEPLMSHDLAVGSHDTFTLDFNESATTIAFEPRAATPSLLATFALLPTLAELLPLRGLTNISHMTVATPILSIQTADLEGSEFTDVAVNFSLQYDRAVLREAELAEGLCVSWRYGER